MSIRKFRIIHLLSFLVCATLGGVAQTIIAPTDTIQESVSLDEIEIVARRILPTMEMQPSAGSFRVGAAAMSYTPALLGAPDPIRVMQSLPAVASSDCISGGIYVQGSENAHNRVNIDGVEIYNPMHLLGLFSVFNAPHFEAFDISMNPSMALSHNFVGAEISANTSWFHPARIQGDISAGIIESHGSIKLPIAKEKTSLNVSGRGTYVNALFKDKIKIENAPLKYGFSDWCFSFLQTLSHDWKMKLIGFYGRDRMDAKDPNYQSDVDLGWKNLALGAALRQGDKQSHTLGYSYFSNRAAFEYVDVKKNMPSTICSVDYAGNMNLGILHIGASITYRHVRPQTSAAANADTLYAKDSWEGSIGAALPLLVKGGLQIRPELKATAYHSESFSHLYVLPSLSVKYELPFGCNIDASVARRAQFTHKVEESAIGFPTDFWMLADGRNQPLQSMHYSLSLQGSAAEGKVNYYLGAYYKSFSNLTDWVGNLFNMLEANYEPLVHVVTGDGRSYGISGMVQARFGALRGWISYTWSKSQQRFQTISDKWYPYSHDRTHDLKVNLTWKIRPNLTFSAIFTYATGNPYTEPLYGYMIGENLILEFKEHNSSRLPSMHRLDFGLNWNFLKTARCSHSLNIGLYNAYGHSNVIFKSFKYDVVDGLMPSQWELSFILPSLSYNLKF